jgi:hypothetical protein
MSILKEGDTDLDEYAHLIVSDDYRIEELEHHLYSFFPIGAPLLSVPFVFIADKLSVPFFSVSSLAEYLSVHRPYTDPIVQRIEQVTASSIVALTAIVIYLIVQRYLDIKRASLLVLIFSFCTSAWSTASRALWQHGPSMFMLAAALYIALLAQKRPHLVQFSAIPLALSYMIRPTNSISILFFTFLVLFKYHKHFLRYCFWASIFAIPFLLYNLSIYHQILSPYYSPQRVVRTPHFFEALFGNLVSPARGLFIFSPVLLFSIYGAVLKAREKVWHAIDFCLVGIIVLHWVVISSFPHWYGGYSIGPRFFTDMIPYLLVFLIPIVARLKFPRCFGEGVFAFGFALTVIISIFVHYRCATDPGPAQWNMWPIAIDRHPDRIWDWRDLQFLRGLRQPRLSVASDTLYVIKQLGEPGSSASLAIQNMGDKLLEWEATPPFGISLSATSGTLQGSNEQILIMSIQSDSYAVGMYNLGGIHIDAVSTSGRSVKGSPSVIPLSLRVLEAQSKIYMPFVVGQSLGGKEISTSRDVFIPPTDIFVNGQRQSASPDQIRAVYGRGWYDVESLEDSSWRWARSPADIYIYSPSNQSVQIVSVPISLNGTGRNNASQGEMQVEVNDRLAHTSYVQENASFGIEVELQKGWNSITFDLMAGNFRPCDINVDNGDSRQLSFAFSSINILLVR